MTIGADILLATQSFTGANGDPLPAPFTARRGTWSIQSNAAYHASGEALGTNSFIASPARANDNLTVVFKNVGDLSNGVVKGAMVRRANGTTSTNNAYVLGVDDTGHACIWKLANDADTLLADGGYQAGNFDGTFKASVDTDGSGNVLLTLTNGAGTTLVSYTHSSASSPLLAGSIGFFDTMNTASNGFDDVQVIGTAAGVNANAPGATSTSQAANATAAAITSCTLTLKRSDQSPLANTSRRFWTKQTLQGAAIDGGANGLGFASDANGVFQLSGLTVPAGPGWLMYKDASDDMTCHIVPVTFA